MDKLQKLYTSIIDGKKQELQAKKNIRDTENEINRLLHVQLVTELSWLTEYGIVPKLVKESFIEVNDGIYNNKYHIFVSGWHVEFENWDISLYALRDMPGEVFVGFHHNKGFYRYTKEELVEYIANHITVHI